ncbi:DUF968 domain-containing protein [Pantoea vagans]|nr:DUF968 domain-containing protein [Pantoea vagans]
MATNTHHLFVISLCRAPHDDPHQDTKVVEAEYGSQAEPLFRFLNFATKSGVIATNEKLNVWGELNMRDMSQVLERWAGWAKSESRNIGYPTIAAGFKGLLPQDSKLTLRCSDEDGLIIEGCLSRLKARRPDEHALIVMYYFFNISKRTLAKQAKRDEKIVRIEIQMAEGFIEGCLAALDVRLDMDDELTPKKNFKKPLMRSATSLVF